MRVGIGFGSNLGDRLVNLRAARAKVLALPSVNPAALSAPLFESSPVDCDDSAGNFLNTVVEVTVPDSTEPERLLTELRQIEVSLGRPSRHPKNSSRSIDLDLLYAEALTRQTPTLILPHPRLHERRFVLAPLAAIRPEMILPGQDRAVAALLSALPDHDRVRLVHDSW